MTEYVKTFSPDDDGQIAISDNGHYAVYVVSREEREYPGREINRYEVVNLSTLAVESRISNLHMALIVMDQFDSRIEQVMTTGVIYDEDKASASEGTPPREPYRLVN